MTRSLPEWIGKTDDHRAPGTVRQHHPNARDITGIRSGSLVAIEPTDQRIRNQIAWRTKCDCGNEFIAPGSELKAGRYVSCGCLANGKPRGIGKHPLYHIHKAMLDRCDNQDAKDYSRYGGRGISVCVEWRDIDVFARDIGARPSPRHSIDRKDNNGNYEPSNCRWATPAEQSLNKRNNYFPSGVSPREECKKAGVKYGTFRQRISKGWSQERALRQASTKEGGRK